ncbi:MAG: PadR family transcriptional regulator [Leptolinea sp.]|jgi:DNA-binding PadR family transcriptional regulator|nr:PadR family transcriptional regulator [Leptolinea sp.]
MDIQYTILGLLNAQPLSGYDLKKIIADSDLFYWSGNNNQIYHSLVNLHKQGLVSVETFQQENLPPRKLYSITPAGEMELRQWLLSDPVLPEIRDPFLIQLAWADQLHGDELDALLARYAEELEMQVRMLGQRRLNPWYRPARTKRETLLWSRIEERLQERYQQELDWVNRLRNEILKNP